MVSAEEHEQVITEEWEVLESIYMDELERTYIHLITDISRNHLRIQVVPEDYDASKKDPVLTLDVQYTEAYPDEVPLLCICVVEDERQVLGAPPPTDDAAETETEVPFVSDTREGVQTLLQGLQQVAEESLGMPMVFSLASHLRESLTDYMTTQAQAAEKAANEQREAELRAEEEKFRGTAVTVERFRAWQVEFMNKRAELKAKEEEAYIATLTAKEREEYRRMKAKPTGRELFTKPGAGIEEDKDTDDAVQDVDWTLYSREDREKQAREDAELETADGYVDDLDD